MWQEEGGALSSGLHRKAYKVLGRQRRGIGSEGPGQGLRRQVRPGASLATAALVLPVDSGWVRILVH